MRAHHSMREARQLWARLVADADPQLVCRCPECGHIRLGTPDGTTIILTTCVDCHDPPTIAEDQLVIMGTIAKEHAPAIT